MSLFQKIWEKVQTPSSGCGLGRVLNFPPRFLLVPVKMKISGSIGSGTAARQMSQRFNCGMQARPCSRHASTTTDYSRIRRRVQNGTTRLNLNVSMHMPTLRTTATGQVIQHTIPTRPCRLAIIPVEQPNHSRSIRDITAREQGRCRLGTGRCQCQCQCSRVLSTIKS